MKYANEWKDADVQAHRPVMYMHILACTLMTNFYLPEITQLFNVLHYVSRTQCSHVRNKSAMWTENMTWIVACSTPRKHLSSVCLAPQSGISLSSSAVCWQSNMLGQEITQPVRLTAVLPPPGQRCGTVCLNSFGNWTSPSDNSNDRWKRLRLVSWTLCLNVKCAD